MLRFLKVILFLFVFVSPAIAQQLSVNGIIINWQNKAPLSFANILIANTTKGTSANSSGEFNFRLEPGEYVFITSYIGFQSDTTKINLQSDVDIKIKLTPIAIDLPEVTVKPGINPADDIIRKTVAAKKLREKLLGSYIFDSFTKGLIKTTGEIDATDQTVAISIDLDTADLKITGIFENQSRGYFKRPDYYKEEIIAQKQTANAPSTINVLTGGRSIQNFYRDDVRFFGRPIRNPIADDALDYYYYFIVDTLALGNLKVFEIYFTPHIETDPGFNGHIYIADSIFAPVKFDVNLNDAANPGGIFSKINVLQQFVLFNEVNMPIDYRLFVEGNFLGIAKFGFEINSVFNNYEINKTINNDFFDMALITVLPDADKKDSLYWSEVQFIPNTQTELAAYERIDSLQSIPVSYWDNFSFLSTQIQMADNLSVSGPLTMYHFNKVEGHSVDIGLNLFDALDKRLNSDLYLSYGFADKRFKQDFYIEYLLGDYRTSSFSFDAFNKLTDVFGESNQYSQFTSTWMSLFTKYDFRDYYYSSGYKFHAGSEIFPVLKVGVGYLNQSDKSTTNRTNFSILQPDDSYDANKQIFDTQIRALSLDFKIDSRKYIEDGYFRRRIDNNRAYLTIEGNALFSWKKQLNSDRNFSLFKLNITGLFNTFNSADFLIKLNLFNSENAVPFQMMYALPGNLESSGKDISFRTLGIGEVYGDKIAMISLQHNFKDELFKIFRLPVLADLQIDLSTYCTLAWADISKSSQAILPTTDFIAFNKPFWEVGFSLGHILIPLSIEFTWKLTHKGKNNFVIGFNTFAL